TCRVVDDLVIIRLQSDADLLSRHVTLNFLLASYCRLLACRIGRLAYQRPWHFGAHARFVLGLCSPVKTLLGGEAVAHTKTARYETWSIMVRGAFATRGRKSRSPTGIAAILHRTSSDPRRSPEY